MPTPWIPSCPLRNTAKAIIPATWITAAGGDGTQHYGGVGLLLRRDLNNGVYYEGSFRAGVMDGDFRGALEGYYTTYDTHARYAGASLGLGRIYQESDKDSVDVYGRSTIRTSPVTM